MLYILSGASRSGKSIITHKLLREKRLAFFSTDFLMMGFYRGLPEHGIDPEAPNDVIAQKLWPVLRGMMTTLIEIKQEYLIEGVALLPKNVRELIDEKGEAEVRACFVGYARADATEKLKNIREFIDSPNDWAKDKTDEYILNFMKGQIEYSKRLEEECKLYKIKYFDTSHNFDVVIGQIFDYISIQ